MKRLFGKDFKYRFTPYEDSEPVKGIPAHTAKALIYLQQPSRSQVVAESGAFATSTKAWVAGATSIEFDITAIPDPDESADSVECQYYIGIKFQADIDEDYQAVILALPMIRAYGTGSALVVTPDDCLKQYKDITAFYSADEIVDQIDIQHYMVKAELASQGYDWSCLWRPDQLKMIIVLLTLSSLLVEQALGEGDKFDLIAKKFEKQAGSLLKTIRLEFDNSDAKGSNVATITPRGPSVCVR